MKKAVFCICLALLLFAAPVSLLITGMCTPAQYGETYYAELADMYRRLKETEGKRIVFVGGSSVAFGLRQDLVAASVEGYTVCPFGLYASIGTKYMLDLSRDLIREGDVVVIAPEQGKSSLSLYFGAEHVWKAADCEHALLGALSWEDLGGMAASYPAFVSQKYSYLCSEPPVPTDVYAKSSFDENCMLVYDRPHNIMAGGTAPVPVSFAKEELTPEFVDYVNDYAHALQKRGAKVLFGFCPVNASAVDPSESPAEYRAYLEEQLSFEVMGTPEDYLFEREWFYDSNVHCNSAGAVLYTYRLIRDLKGCLGDPSPTEIEIPETPALPSEGETEGDNTFGEYFLYEESGEGVRIVGMDERGKALSSFTVPASYRGKPVRSIAPNALSGSAAEEIRLQENVRSLEDGCFAGCASLKRLYMAPSAPPARCTPSAALRDGAPNLKVYVEKDLLSAYANDYFWSRYAAILVPY